MPQNYRKSKKKELSFQVIQRISFLLNAITAAAVGYYVTPQLKYDPSQINIIFIS